MLTVHRYWPWTLALLFIRIGPFCCSTTILRPNEPEASSLAGIKRSPCSQQLEKLKIETQRHISALMSTASRKRKLLATLLPIESIPKPLAKAPSFPSSDSTAARLPKKTESTETPLEKYLSSLDHSGWVSKCLKGDKCRITDSEYGSFEAQVSEAARSKGTTEITTKASSEDENAKADSMSEINEPNRTFSFDVPQSNGRAAPDSDARDSDEKPNKMFDLLPLTYDTVNDSGAAAASLTVGTDAVSSVKNDPLLNTKPVDYSKVSVDNEGDLGDETDIIINGKMNENDKCNLGHATDRAIAGHWKGEQGEESDYFPSLILNESPSNPTRNYAFVLEEKEPFQIGPFQNPPNSNRAVHYNTHFVPLTIHFTPMTYYHRYPRGEESTVFENTFVPNTEHDGSVGKIVRDVGSLDYLTASYGDELMKRGFTGKRSSEFDGSKKEAVTTYYPEIPTPNRNPVDHLFTKVAHEGNNSDSNVYLFVGGSWVANFKENPRFFYLQPGSRQFTDPPPLTQTSVAVDSSSHASYQRPSSIHSNCHAKWNFDPLSNARPAQSHHQPSYAVNERSHELSWDSNSGYDAKLSDNMKVPSTVAARNGYSWYDYNSMTNDVDSSPMINGPFSGRPVAFPDNGQRNPTSFPSEADKNEVIQPKTRDLHYEDSLVNFPPRKSEPQAVGPFGATTPKPEEFMLHDIDTADMLTVGTQVLSIFPLTPSERRYDESSDPTYGSLVADESARASPPSKSNGGAGFTAFTDTMYGTTGLNNSPRLRLPNRPDLYVPSTFGPSSLPNEFEFVSGQWIKRRPAVTDISSQRFIYDRLGRRNSRGIVDFSGRTVIGRDIQHPIVPFKSKCVGRSKRSHSQFVPKN